MAVQGTGALSQSAYITSNGWQDVGSNNNGATGGGTASATTLINGGAQFVKGGTAVDTYVSSGGLQEVSAGGQASGGTVFSNGKLQVYAGGTGTNNVVLAGGQANIWGVAQASNGLASGLTIQNGGSAVSLSGGRLTALSLMSGGRTIVSSGGSIDQSVLSAGGQVRIQSGGTASQLTAFGTGWWSYSAGAVLVGSGGTALNTVLSGAYQAVQGQGAYTENTLVTNSGWQDVGLNSFDGLYGGGIASGSVLVSGGKQFVSGGTALTTMISAGGTQTVMYGGVVSGSVVASAGFITVLSGGTGYNANALSGGRVVVASGGTLSGGIIASGATLSGSAGALWGGNLRVGGSISGGSIVSKGVAEISSGGTARDLFVASGGSLQVDAGGTLTGLANLAAGGIATLDASAGGTVNLGGNGFSRLTLTGKTSPSSIISGFNGTSPGSSDQIVLRDVPKSDILGVTYPDADHVKFLLTGNRSLVLNIPGVKSFGFDLSEGTGNSTVFSVCFLSGTMIRTPDGERAIETLSAGDAVHVYHRGCVETQNVIWVGYRSITEEDSASYDITDYPVRIEAEAFGGGMPYKDLLVTPEHCVFLAGNLVPVRMLVNGRSIRHDTSLKSYGYYHIETDCHSVVMADGLLCESYLDSGNRHDLAARSWVEAPLPVVSGMSGKHRMAAPLCVSRAFVEPIWKGLARRAGQVCDTRDIRHIDPMFHLSTEEGHIMEPLRVAGDRYIFQIPGHYGAVYLCSRAARPSDAVGPYVDDRRQLGVLIGAGTLYDPSSTQEIDVRDFLHAARGWHAAENGQLRWTSGRAFLPLDTLKDAGMRILAVQIVAGGPYHSATH
ncbi:Hint domain-containing protein [Asaia spathodeae]|uniref:Hint domain-containing protein n=1 Tax=Asaia spathodeae TaxID=657016 RepID=UPI002FC364D0